MNEARLVHGSTGKHLVNLTIPMFLGISSMFVASMIDIIYVGWIGSQELAAISFTFPIVMGMTTLTMGIGVGAASIIARMVGRGERALVPRLATHALLLAALFVATLSTLMWVFQESVFKALGADAGVLPLITGYMGIWVCGLPLFALPMVSTMIMRSVGNARTPGLIMAGSAALQVVMAPPFMFGLPVTRRGWGSTARPGPSCAPGRSSSCLLWASCAGCGFCCSEFRGCGRYGPLGGRFSPSASPAP